MDKLDILNKRFYIALAILISGILVNCLGTFILSRIDLPYLPDLILDRIPLIQVCYLYNVISILSFLIFVMYVIYQKPEQISYFVLMFGIAQWVRAFFIILTPLGLPNNITKGLLQFGAFPSGHAQTQMLYFLNSQGSIRDIFFVLMIFEIFFLIISKAHYSIDIFGALLFGYAIYQFCEHHFKNHSINPAQ